MAHLSQIYGTNSPKYEQNDEKYSHGVAIFGGFESEYPNMQHIIEKPRSSQTRRYPWNSDSTHVADTIEGTTQRFAQKQVTHLGHKMLVVVLLVGLVV